MSALGSGRWLGVLTLALLTQNACKKPISKGECDQLLDHYVELLLKADRPEVRAEELLRLQHDARTKAAQDPTFSHCPEEVSRAQFHCAMQAKNPDRLEQCMLE